MAPTPEDFRLAFCKLVKTLALLESGGDDVNLAEMSVEVAGSSMSAQTLAVRLWRDRSEFPSDLGYPAGTTYSYAAQSLFSKMQSEFQQGYFASFQINEGSYEPAPLVAKSLDHAIEEATAWCREETSETAASLQRAIAVVHRHGNVVAEIKFDDSGERLVSIPT